MYVICEHLPATTSSCIWPGSSVRKAHVGVDSGWTQNGSHGCEFYCFAKGAIRRFQKQFQECIICIRRGKCKYGCTVANLRLLLFRGCGSYITSGDTAGGLSDLAVLQQTLSTEERREEKRRRQDGVAEGMASWSRVAFRRRTNPSSGGKM